MKIPFTAGRLSALVLPPLALPALALSALLLPGTIGTAHAAETIAEKAQATGNDATRAVKKAAHRADEATCLQSDVKCLQEKAKHRLQEASDYTKDKASELKNEIDDDANE
jgi:hypothetical protein